MCRKNFENLGLFVTDISVFIGISYVWIKNFL